MLPHCQMKATGGTSPTASFANGSKSDPSTPDRKSMTTNSPKAKHPCTPTTPAGRSWHDTGGQMPNTTWTRRAEAARNEPKPQHREITQQNQAKHIGASRSPNTGEGSKEPKIPSTRNHKNHPTRRGEEERKTKATQRKQNETKTRKAKESTGTKRERRRKDARTGQPREEAEMKAW